MPTAVQICCRHGYSIQDSNNQVARQVSSTSLTTLNLYFDDRIREWKTEV